MNPYYGGPGFRKHAHPPGAGQRAQRWPATSAPQDSYKIPRSPAPTYGSAPNIQPEEDNLRNPRARPPFHDGDQSIHDTQSCISDFPTAHPMYTIPGSSSFRAEAVSLSPSAGSSWSARHHSVPRMPEALYDYDYPGYEGQGNEVSHMEPGTYLSEECEDDYDSQMESPTLLDTERHDNEVPKRQLHSFFDDAYYDLQNRPSGSRNFSNTEREHDSDLQMLPQSRLNTHRQDYNESQMPAQSFRNDKWDDFDGDEWKDFVHADMGSHNSSDTEHEDDDYPQMSPRSMPSTNFHDHNDPQLSPSVFFDPVWDDPDDSQLSYPPLGNTEWQDHGVCPAATQNFFNNELNHDYNPQAIPQAPHGDRSDGRKRVGNRGIHRIDDCGLSAAQQQDIKVRYAGGMSLDTIAKRFYLGKSRHTLRRILVGQGWRIWSDKEDAKIRELYDQGNTWAQISSELRDVRRTEEEVEARAKYLQVEGPDDETRHRYEQDEYIRRGRAQGLTYPQMIKENFPGMSRRALEGRARKISAVWGKNDDQKLEKMVGDGTEVDWDSIAAEYKPPRQGDILKTRWDYLRMKEQARNNRIWQ